MERATLPWLRALAASGAYERGFLAVRRRAQIEAAPGEWEDRGEYWLNASPQGSDAWLALRRDLLTGSNVGAAAGHSKFSGPLDVALDTTGVRRKEFSAENLRVMAQGSAREPRARELYEAQTGQRVVEVGLAVPKWEPRLGSSLDGDVVGTAGVIEIKAPDRGIYRPLLERDAAVAAGRKFGAFDRAHIWPTHYDQMQVGMKVAGKEWCDYVVYEVATGRNLRPKAAGEDVDLSTSERIRVERIPFDARYWDEELWPAIRAFLDGVLEPLVHAREAEQDEE